MIAKRNKKKGKIKKNRRIGKIKKKKEIDSRKVVFFLCLLVFFAATVWIFFFSPLMQISSISVQSDKLENSEIQESVKQVISAKRWGIFPKDNLFLAPKKEIRESLSKRHKLIRKVWIDRIFPNELLIKIEERQSQVIWCNARKCFLVDELGEAFFEIDPAESSAGFDEGLERIFDLSGREIELGQRVINPDLVGFCHGLNRRLAEELDLEFEDQVSTPSSMSEEIRAKTKQGWQIFFSTSRDFGVQTTILKEFLKEKIDPLGQREKLEYIDLRIRGKVIYKLENSEEEDEEESEEEE